MDLIAFDIGNSSVKVAVYDENEIKESVSIAIDSLEADLPGILVKYREICGPQQFDARTVPLPTSSVSSENMALVEKIVSEVFDQRLMLAGRDFPVEMNVGVENPDKLGPDRLLTALAAFQVVGRAVVVADFGTATTIDLVNDSGIFMGGVIIPGLDLAARSLHEHTSALPYVCPTQPEANASYGTNTEMAINNGIYFATLGALRELVERYATELGYWPQVIATGGYAKMLAANSDLIENVVPNLCINGLYLAFNQWYELQDTPDELLQYKELEEEQDNNPDE
ncbi:MAG: type III pantothenate kinase [Sedimentisphaerales bacterium]|nr:type III pantothenate kinase [Sedimentisphaerales bacterium]MBN2843154.1 type III pantothenate kinase [Sedimentisphaerales bacterium]